MTCSNSSFVKIFKELNNAGDLNQGREGKLISNH